MGRKAVTEGDRAVVERGAVEGADDAADARSGADQDEIPRPQRVAEGRWVPISVVGLAEVRGLTVEQELVHEPIFHLDVTLDVKMT